MTVVHSKSEAVGRARVKSTRAIEKEDLEKATAAPFVPKANRMAELDIVSLATMETAS
jgi:hypothetical protein